MSDQCATSWWRRHSQVEFVSDKSVFQGLEVGAGLRVLVGVEVWDVGLERRADLGHDGVPHPSNAHPFPQFTLLQKGEHEALSNCGLHMHLRVP